jgi:hypothetical protein
MTSVFTAAWRPHSRMRDLMRRKQAGLGWRSRCLCRGREGREGGGWKEGRNGRLSHGGGDSHRVLVELSAGSMHSFSRQSLLRLLLSYVRIGPRTGARGTDGERKRAQGSFASTNPSEVGRSWSSLSLSLSLLDWARYNQSPKSNEGSAARRGRRHSSAPQFFFLGVGLLLWFFFFFGFFFPSQPVGQH